NRKTDAARSAGNEERFTLERHEESRDERGLRLHDRRGARDDGEFKPGSAGQEIFGKKPRGGDARIMRRVAIARDLRLVRGERNFGEIGGTCREAEDTKIGRRTR